MYTHPVLAMIRCMAQTEALNARATDIFELELQHNNAEIQRLQEESLEISRKEEEETKSRSNWSIFNTATQYAANGSAIAVGTAVGGPAGGLVAISGALGLAGRVTYDTGFTKWVASCFTPSEETQYTIASHVETATSYLSAGLGVAGGLWTMHVNALSASILADQLKKYLGLTTAVASTS